MGRRGVYDIIITFFLIITLIFAVLLFLYMNARSGALYSSISKVAAGPRDASGVKDGVLACHKLEYLQVSMMDEPCQAKQMLGGYRVRQLAINGCQERTWEYTTVPMERAQVVPFVVALEQPGGKRCLASLDVFVEVA